MNIGQILKLIAELLDRLQNDQQVQALNIDWSVLIKYLPEIVDLVMRIIKDMQGAPALKFSSQEAMQEFLADKPQLQAIDWSKLISILLPILLELIGNKQQGK